MWQIIAADGVRPVVEHIDRGRVTRRDGGVIFSQPIEITALRKFNGERRTRTQDLRRDRFPAENQAGDSLFHSTARPRSRCEAEKARHS